MAISAFAKARLQSVSDSGFARAKKLAEIAIKTSADGRGNPTAEGYAKAKAFLEPYQVQGSEKDSLAATALIAGYDNSITKLSAAKAKRNRTVGQLQLDERDVYLVTPSSEDRASIMRDVPQLVGDVAEDLRAHLFAVQTAIDSAYESGEPTAELEKYQVEAQARADVILQLDDDIRNGEVSEGEVRETVGLYVDADQDDGTVRGVGVMPTGNLPFGFKQGDFRELDSSASIGSGSIPVLSRFSDDGVGNITSRVGPYVWSGSGSFDLGYDKRKSAAPQFANEPGEFSLSSVPIGDSGDFMRPGKFFSGYTGLDGEGNPKKTLFYMGRDGKRYTVDDQTRASLESDPVTADAISRADGVSDRTARALLAEGATQPFERSSFDVPEPAQVTEAESPPRGKFFAGTSRPDPRGPNYASVAESPSLYGSGLKNRPPQQDVARESSGGSPSANDIVSKGRQFFRKIVGG